MVLIRASGWIWVYLGQPMGHVKCLKYRMGESVARCLTESLSSTVEPLTPNTFRSRILAQTYAKDRFGGPQPNPIGSFSCLLLASWYDDRPRDV